MNEYIIHLRKPHAKQREFIESPAKRKVIRAGRRSGKTTGIGIYAARMFLNKRRVLYTAPTADQVGKFWFEVTQAFKNPIATGALYKNETGHIIEVPDTEIRIRAKTAWNADTLRGDYADVLIFDEWQLMNEDAWRIVGAPMLLDNNGDAVFIYTPPSIHSRSVTKATDPIHAAKLYKMAQADKSGRWAVFHFTSHDNPHISAEALDEIEQDMTALAYRQEILAEDVEDVPGALWTFTAIDECRVMEYPALHTVAVAVDPSTTSGGDACGIVAGGIDRQKPNHGYVLDDMTVRGSPATWAKAALLCYAKHQADKIIYESNQGGEMVETIIRDVAKSHPEIAGVNIKIESVRATRGKQVRAQPISALYEQKRIHHVGIFARLEDELCEWTPESASSPNRLDALVWLFTSLMSGAQRAKVVSAGWNTMH